MILANVSALIVLGLVVIIVMRIKHYNYKLLISLKRRSVIGAWADR